MKSKRAITVCIFLLSGCLYQTEFTPFETPAVSAPSPDLGSDCTPTAVDELCRDNPCTPDVDAGCGKLVSCGNCETCAPDAPRPGSACSEEVFDCCDPLVTGCSGESRCAFRQALVEVPESPPCVKDDDCTDFGVAKCLQRSCVTPVVGLSCTTYDDSTEFSAAEGASCNYESEGVTIQCTSGLSCAPISLTSYRCFRFCELATGSGCENSQFDRCEKVEGLPFALGEMLTAQGYGVCVQKCR